MRFPKLGLLTLKLLLVVLLPVAAYLWSTQDILKKQIQTVVTNDPEITLSRGLSTVKLALNQFQSEVLIRTTRLAGKDKLRQLMTAKKIKISKISSFLAGSTNPETAPLLVLAEPDGSALYNSLATPTPTVEVQLTPTSTSTPISKKKKSKKSSKSSKKISTIPTPPLPSVNDVPGIDEALHGAPTTGILPFQDKFYFAAAVPIPLSSRKTGALMIGVPFDSQTAEDLKKSIQNDLVFYSQGKIRFSTLAAAVESEIGKGLTESGWQETEAPPSQPLTFNQTPCAWNAIPVMDIRHQVLGSILIFQPLQRKTTVVGDPQRLILKWGLILLLFLFALVSLLGRDIIRILGDLGEAAGKIRDGDPEPSLPVRRMDELGDLARSMGDMAEGLREKDRISLVLGKVVSPQAAKKILAEKDYFALKGERRECTLMQADLRGFQVLSVNMNPEALVDSLNQYFQIINQVVFKYEGMLDRFSGGTALAVWGAPFTHEDKEWRAVQSALEIQESLREFNISRIQKNQPPFNLVIGIHTGTVVTGNLGSEQHCDYSVIGEPLQVASRLCSMASPNQILATEETYQKIKTQVSANSLKPMAVQDSNDSLQTYEIVKLI